jgi:UDP-2,3-diacylglucosamine hydrolase
LVLLTYSKRTRPRGYERANTHIFPDVKNNIISKTIPHQRSVPNLKFRTFELMPGSKIYFASDFHLGVPNHQSSREREDRIVRWLDMVKVDAAEIYLIGDIFDFWFEYSVVVPKGFIRFQGKLAELCDAGIKITFFKGNHDMWMFDYFKQELGIDVISDELVIERNGKKFYLHHGDGLGPGDFKYKLLKKVFRSKFCQWLFARLHPNLGMGIAQKWSKNSRLQNAQMEIFENVDDEWLYTYSKELLRTTHFDFLIFGHRHLPLDIRIGESRYINLGEWINFNSYAVFDGENVELKYFEGADS